MAADVTSGATREDETRLHLLRPGPGAVLSPGSRVNGVGWVVCASPVLAIELFLGGIALGRARLGLSAADFAMLTGETQSDQVTGFVFALVVPLLPPGPVSLVLEVATASGRHAQAVAFVVAGPAPPAQEPARGMIETAAIDARGILRVAGWAVSRTPIARLQVFLGSGGRLLGEAQIGLQREDVAAALPDYPDAGASGFLLRQELTDADLAHEDIRVVVRSRDGTAQNLSARLTRAAMPRRKPPEVVAELACEEASLTDRGDISVKGWAVASSGVAAIRVELDEAVIGQASTGEDRPDVGNRYPRIAAARQAGFRWRATLNRPLSGAHVLRLTVLGRDGESASCFQAVTVTVPPAEPAEAAIRCFLDLPACRDGVAIEAARGFLSLSGWAFSSAGIDHVEVFVDGISQGRAHHGIRREDLRAAFPDDDALLAGFAMVLPALRPGSRAVRVAISDRAGGARDLSFTIQAEPAILGPGPWEPRARLNRADIDLRLAILAARGHAPRWAILLPGASEAGRAALLADLEAQAYAGWSLVAEDASQSLADADFVIRLAPGDRLGCDALLEFSLASLMNPGADFLYSDERRRDPSDGKIKAFFKPDFSPDLLLSTHYIGRIWAATPALLREAGPRQDDLGDYDSVLRLTELAREVLHVPRVLCAAGPARDSPRQEQAALRAAMRRRGIAGEILPGPIRGSHRIRRDVLGEPLVSIIIPTNGARGLVRGAIESIRARTAWARYEIICLDHIADPADPLKAWIAARVDRVIAMTGAFNWSRFNNLGAAAAAGSLLLFLNDDIEVADPDWLRGLIEHAQRPEIGAVGPQLRYPDGRVQHAGMFLGRRAARHAFRFYPGDEPGPFGLARTTRDVISVTGACLMTSRAAFEALGGFDEAHPVINNDLDYCLRARASGRGVVYTPAVSLTHHEMVSRADLPDAFDAPRFAAAWGDVFLRGDPFFSRHFSPDHDDCLPDAEPVRVFVAGGALFARAEIQRILVVKVDHIGDFITAFPALRRLRERFPGAHLTVLAASASLSLAALEPAIDEIIEFNFYHARSEKGRRSVGSRALAALRARLAPRRFDLAIDLRRQPDTRPILRATGARFLAGFDQNYAHPWLDVAVEFEGDVAGQWKTRHVTDSLVGLIEAVAARASDGAPRARAARVADGPPVVCVHAGAGSTNKQWPAESFAGLIDLLVGEFGARILLIGGPDEAAVARLVLSAARRRESVVDLVGRTKLGDLPAVLLGADLYVGNDSGPKHMAAALGVPTIGIHSGSVDAGEWGAAGPRALTIRRDVICSPCYLARASDCHRGLACLDGIRVEDVAAACRLLLAERGIG